MPEPLILRANDGCHRMVIEYDYEMQEICIKEQVFISEKVRYGYDFMVAGFWEALKMDMEYKAGVSIDEKFLPKFTCWLIQLCKELQKEIQEELPVKIEWLAQVQRLLEER